MELLFNPFFWITIVSCLYLLVRHRVWKIRLKYLCIFLFLVLTNNWVSKVAMSLLEYETITAEEIVEPYDIGIVLGPFIDDGGNLPVRSEAVRFTQAVQLYRLGKFNKILLSGNDISDLTQAHLIDSCIPSEDILVEDKSNNTHENALLSTRLLHQRGDTSKRILLITSAYHMRRAKRCFAKVGLTVTPFSVDHNTSCSGICTPSLSDIIPHQSALWRWERLSREWASMVYFKLKNYI